MSCCCCYYYLNLYYAIFFHVLSKFSVLIIEREKKDSLMVSCVVALSRFRGSWRSRQVTSRTHLHMPCISPWAFGDRVKMSTL